MKDKILRILRDPCIQDVAKDASLLELQELNDVAEGKVIHLILELFNRKHLEIPVAETSNVAGLQKAIERAISYQSKKLLGDRHVSWKYVWKNWCIAFGEKKLTVCTQTLSILGLRSGSVIHFHSLLRDRIEGKRANKQHRVFKNSVNRKHLGQRVKYAK